VGANDRLGTAVALEGNTAVLGAPDQALAEPGSAYVFTRSAGVWTQQQKLQAVDGASGERYGTSVALSGDTLLAGTPFQRSGAGEDAGSAYVYVLSSGTWTFQQKLSAGDGASSDVFGLSVAASGSSVLAGVPYDDTAAGIDTGSAYVFTRSGTNWQMQAKLTAGTAAANDYFGTSVSLAGDKAVVGAPQIDPEQELESLRGPGKAFVFQRTGTAWSAGQSLAPADGATDDFFGRSVAVSGSSAVVGAPRHDPVARANAGAAYVFVESGGVWAVNNKLRDVELIGLGRIEGPEDVILDRDNHLYAGSRHGDIMRFLAPDYQQMEVFAHIGGTPLGMAFDRDFNLNVCVGGMGLYRVTPEREVQRVTDETNRSWASINDDSRLRLADDLDIADDGRIFFSEATVRYEMHEWPLDGLEARGNGRIVCYDPRDGSTRTVLRGLRFPNGICIATDRQSILFAETWGCCVKRYWFDGPRAGQVEMVLDNLPGYPDNINLASDGNYWMALVGMRAPAYDLAMRMPGFRKRMAQRVALDEWLFPNINTGCVLKFNERGEVLETLWDLGGENHPMITSMREHQGYLYLGGISNNRIGRYKLTGADPGFSQYEQRWRTA
jgi:sugar lactone lactonase YvrE